MKKEYRISKITEKYRETYNGIDVDFDTLGYDITLTNVNNPFDYFSQYVPLKAYSKEEFPIGRVIELEDDEE